jgi:hypothetical protein
LKFNKKINQIIIIFQNFKVLTSTWVWWILDKNNKVIVLGQDYIFTLTSIVMLESGYGGVLDKKN